MSNLIPKTLHFVWVGDESKIPNNCIDTWKKMNPECHIKIWGNNEYKNTEWLNLNHMESFWKDDQLCGVADLMRWEILLKYGGVALDADSICLRPFEDWFFDCELFAAYENEIVRPGLISNGVVGAKIGNLVIEHIVSKLNIQKDITRKFVWYRMRRRKQLPWKTSGPMALTDSITDTHYSNATILPSHFFLPKHYSGVVYTGTAPVYCTQLWGSSLSAYDDIYSSTVD